MTTDFFPAVTAPFELATGGLFVPFFWGVVVIAVYIKYRAAVLALLAGAPLLIGSGILLPDRALIAIAFLVVTAFGIGVYYIVTRSPQPGEKS